MNIMMDYFVGLIVLRLQALLAALHEWPEVREAPRAAGQWLRLICFVRHVSDLHMSSRELHVAVWFASRGSLLSDAPNLLAFCAEKARFRAAGGRGTLDFFTNKREAGVQ